MMRRPEILAPVGSLGALDAALAVGADAVYLGTDSFNARRGAENFSVSQLPAIVARCHMRGTKLYLALNILMLEQEREALLQVARAACDAGVDAVIVQDLGVASLLNACAPNLRLHASTQMAIHNVHGAKLLERLGFTRVVLARECTREEIAEIVCATSLEVEVFVHGAQCMCVSGQCYMSAILGQRSGNRGLCAQPCRLAFQSETSEHALSLKDMSLMEHLRELGELGVFSLKIEGRMKRPEYVAASVTACRDAIEGRTPDLESLRAVFSRDGFTDGYYMNRRDQDMFGIRGKDDVTAAAGVLGKLSTLYTDNKQHVQKVGIAFDFKMESGNPSTLCVSDAHGHKVCVTGAVAESALHKSTDAARVRTSLEKTGGTPYFLQKIDCQIEDGLMLPASALNAMRREALTGLDAQRAEVCPIAFNEQHTHMHTREVERALRPALRIDVVQSEQVSGAMAKEAELITLPLEVLYTMVQEGSDPLLAYKEKICASVPRICFEGLDDSAEKLAFLAEHGVKHAQAENVGAVALIRETKMMMHISPFMNVLNSYAVQCLLELGAKDICLSPELSLTGAVRLPHSVPVGLVVYGYLPLMTVRVCPVRVSVGCAKCRAGADYITDRKGNQLHINCGRGCCELLNPVPIYMADRLEELAGLDFITMRFSTEDTRTCENYFSDYRRGAKSDEPFTRGLLYRTIF